MEFSEAGVGAKNSIIFRLRLHQKSTALAPKHCFQHELYVCMYQFLPGSVNLIFPESFFSIFSVVVHQNQKCLFNLC